MAIKMPPSMGGPVQAIKPLPGGIDAVPITISGVTATTIAGAADTALYIMADIPCHIRFDGAAATVNDAPLPANVPMVFSCNKGDQVSVIQATGQTGGLLYVHDVETL